MRLREIRVIRIPSKSSRHRGLGRNKIHFHCFNLSAKSPKHTAVVSLRPRRRQLEITVEFLRWINKNSRIFCNATRGKKQSIDRSRFISYLI